MKTQRGGEKTLAEFSRGRETWGGEEGGEN